MLWIYLKSRKWTAALWTLLIFIFETVLYLYGLPADALLYPALLSAALGLCFFAGGFYRFRKKHRELQALLKTGVFGRESLPETADGIELDYQEIAAALLSEKQRLMDEMNRRYHEMTDYYTMWAHQIKTPIAAMGLVLQEDGSGDGQDREELSLRLQEIEQYVEMVLGYMRLESDSTDYVIREYPLEPIVKQAVKKYAARFIQKKIRLELAEMDCTVLTDEKWLSFVLEQVLSNALKYTKAGSIRIWLEPEKTLCVRDTGIGIAADDLPRIFEKGYTGCNGRRDKKASGIGLYLCRRICRGLGHTISAKSKAGEGTTVFIGLGAEKLEVE